ncbi:gluconate 2-dehydrogenase subunit 3 family protein [Janthinobacterium sp.]|uniref:gluconate 2-dehydrogenase subunit 3 family protein n=1 Tax=Janthinobacterium sp. TaxID=1871054 RepID=UPI00262740CA|nr:gluconate 2-dehydrogenase subunit 3 family protein [Janthinobacterium sp.]
MSIPNTPNTRRSFLGKGLWLMPLAGLQACDFPSDTGSHVAGRAGPAGPTGASYVPVFLTQPEWLFVTAMSDRLIPSDAMGPGAVEAGVPEFVDRQMATPSALTMPGFSASLSNQDVADVVNFVRNSWGSQASRISASAVARERKKPYNQPPVVSSAQR